ncbi:MAG: hemolysin family protein [Planctomycetota bacterium]|nr:hemolysin family protein [Planctomycetota bacterium]
MLELILYGLGTLAGSFFCSLSEAAVLACSEARIRSRIEQNLRGALRLLQLKQDPSRTLASIVFLNNIFAIAGTALLTAQASDLITTGGGMLVFVCGWTLLIIAFGEIVPKLLGEALPEPIAGFVAPALHWVRRTLTPLVKLVEFMVAWAKPRRRVAQGGEDEITELARLGHERGHIDMEEAELIRRIFRLDDITAEDVMTPRPLLQAVDVTSTLDDIRDELMTSNHQQFPVYEGDLDKVVGVLPLQTALKGLVRGEAHRSVADYMHSVLFLPVSKKVDDVLTDLQAAHGRMAVVIDEYGVTEGVITMDDLVEELVGEAIDDVDVSEGLVKRLSRRAALVHGLTRVRDVARFLKCPVVFTNTEQENTTISGLFQERLHRVPVEGDRIELPPGLRFIVREADERAAIRVFAKNVDPASETEANGAE